MAGVEGISTIQIAPKNQGQFFIQSFLTFCRAETLATIEQAQRGSGERQVSGPRAEFWKLRGLRGNKKNEKTVRRTRDDLLQLTIQGKFPAYERVLLREGSFANRTPSVSQQVQFQCSRFLLSFPTANFKRPIVIMGPLNDIAMEKLAREMPDEYEVAGLCLPPLHCLLSLSLTCIFLCLICY